MIRIDCFPYCRCVSRCLIMLLFIFCCDLAQGQGHELMVDGSFSQVNQSSILKSWDINKGILTSIDGVQVLKLEGSYASATQNIILESSWKLLQLQARVCTVEIVKGNQNWKNADLASWDKIRISNMIPLGKIDLTPNRALMLETNLDIFSAVDFNKGCFIGQEVTARTKYRGLAKKKMIPISSPTPLRNDMLVYQGEKQIGCCHSSVKLENESYIALATLRIDAIKLYVDSKNYSICTSALTIKLFL